MISVIIPTYNRPQYLARLLNSIKQQTFQEFEVIVVDDHSPNIKEYALVIEQYKKAFKAFRYERIAKSSGAPTARNLGIKLAKFNWVALVDDDDEWLPEKLAKQWQVVENSTDKLGLVYAWSQKVDQSGKVCKEKQYSYSGDVTTRLLMRNFIASPSVLVNKEALININLFDPALPSCQDWDTWLRIALNGYKFAVISEILCIYHVHNSGSISLSKKIAKGYSMFLKKHWYNFLKHGTPFIWAIACARWVKILYRTRKLKP